jgi:hypothetical protein
VFGSIPSQSRRPHLQVRRDQSSGRRDPSKNGSASCNSNESTWEPYTGVLPSVWHVGSDCEHNLCWHKTNHSKRKGPWRIGFEPTAVTALIMLITMNLPVFSWRMEEADGVVDHRRRHHQKPTVSIKINGFVSVSRSFWSVRLLVVSSQSLHSCSLDGCRHQDHHHSHFLLHHQSVIPSTLQHNSFHFQSIRWAELLI